VLERIAAAACPGREDLVVEIGPGRGALTRKLLRGPRAWWRGSDAALAEGLRRSFATNRAWKSPRRTCLRSTWRVFGRAAIAGNLPYYITSRYWTDGTSDAAAAVFLVQKKWRRRLARIRGARLRFI